MIAHNVVIGESSILVAQTGIAGSAELGRGVVLGAKAGINGHITIGDGVQVAGHERRREEPSGPAPSRSGLRRSRSGNSWRGTRCRAVSKSSRKSSKR